MKLITILSLIIGSISLLPTVSFADNVNTNHQEVNQSSTVIGNGNIAIVGTRQNIINSQQKTIRPISNTSSNSQKININTTIIGDGNIDIKKINQEIIHGQQE
jgi:hypothetical protein